MSTPCLCRGWPDALLLHTDKGGHDSGRSNGPIPPCPSSLPALWLATELQGGRRKKDRFKRAGPSSHPPVKREASKLQVGAAHRTKQQQKQATAPSCTPELPRPAGAGTSELQGDVHDCPRSSTIEGGREMRLMWGDGRSRKLFASMAPEGPGSKNNNTVV